MDLSERRMKASEGGLTLLRVVVGVIMAAHGWQKVTSLDGVVRHFGEMGMPAPEAMAYLATAGEFLGGLGLVLGLLTPVAAFGVAATMAVAVLVVHLPNGLFAKDGGFEYPLTIFAVALFFMVRGGGRFSVDGLLRRAREPGQETEGTASEEEGEAEAAEGDGTAVPPEPPAFRETPADAALQLLGILQREGRLVDFLEEDVSSFSDADIGAAARVVHEGCHKALHEHFTIEAVRPEDEGDRVTIQEGFDPAEVRLTGNVVGDPPFTGTLQHRGWRVGDVHLPKLAAEHDPTVLAPAEVEL